jgi:hypothetical protein
MRALEMLEPFRCRCNRGWICQRHPDTPFLHGHCSGPGIPCRQRECPYWQGPRPLAREPRVQFAYIFTLRDMMRAGAVRH